MFIPDSEARLSEGGEGANHYKEKMVYKRWCKFCGHFDDHESSCPLLGRRVEVFNWCEHFKE